MEAEFDRLRRTINQAINKIRAESTSPAVDFRCARLLEDTTALYESIDTTRQYQVVALQRTGDYLKASSTAPLTPILGAVHLPHLMQMVRDWSHHQHPHRTVNIHPPEGASDHLTTDHLYLSENLLCLVNNAIKYSPEGVVNVRMKVIHADGTASAPPASVMLVTVSDMGSGVPDEAKRGVFFLFQRPANAPRGVGLSLYSLYRRTEGTNTDTSCVIGVPWVTWITYHILSPLPHMPLAYCPLHISICARSLFSFLPLRPCSHSLPPVRVPPMPPSSRRTVRRARQRRRSSRVRVLVHLPVPPHPPDNSPHPPSHRPSRHASYRCSGHATIQREGCIWPSPDHCCR